MPETIINFYDRFPPPLLYRYEAFDRALAFIKDPHLNFQRPTSFNDPFEFRPKIRINQRGRDLESLFRHNNLSLNTSIEEAEHQLARRVHGDASSRYHVLCFTEKPLDVLMWAHYGRSHTGCVLGFDSDLFAPFMALGMTAGPVIYSDTRPTVAIPEERDDWGTIKGIFTKGSMWSYEHEWRIALLSKGPSKDRMFNLPDGVLRFVILGARCNDDNYREIRNALRSNRALKNVEILKAHVRERDDDFGLGLTWQNGSHFNLFHYICKFEQKRAIWRERGGTWYAQSLRRRREVEAQACPVP